MPRAGEWSLDPDWLTVNNGSFGACPRTVREAQAAWRDRFERQPTAFMHRDLTALLRHAAAATATYLGAHPADLVFVENASAGINAVLRSLSVGRHDEILLFDQAYGAVRNTVRFVAAASGARIVEVPLPFPRAEPAAILDRLDAAINGRTRLAVLDHITSPGALVLPAADIAALCRRRGVAVLIDGAHVPGQLPLDLAAIGADFYAANLHKWLFAPVGTGVLHVRADRQADIHPTTISHGLGHGFLAEFDWTGTRDVSGWLAAPDAIALHRSLGGPDLMARNAALAVEGAVAIASELATDVAPGCLPGGAMALVRLPASFGAGQQAALSLRERLVARRVDAPVNALGDALWVRISAQAFNRIEDYTRLASILSDMA
jgi:isopenicillin-N epimerase